MQVAVDLRRGTYNVTKQPSLCTGELVSRNYYNSREKYAIKAGRCAQVSNRAAAQRTQTEDRMIRVGQRRVAPRSRKQPGNEASLDRQNWITWEAEVTPRCFDNKQCVREISDRK